MLLALYLTTGLLCMQGVCAQGTGDGATSGPPGGADPAGVSVQTRHYDLRFRTPAVPLSPRRLAREVEAMHAYVAGRLGRAPHLRLAVSFEQAGEPPCGARARTRGAWDARPAGPALPDARPFPADPDIVVFVSAATDATGLPGILAHEIAHIFSLSGLTQGWGPALPSNTTTVRAGIIEGVATWAAGRYWLAAIGHASFDEAVRHQASAYGYTPLAEAHPYTPPEPSADASACYRERDALYTQWASFVGYLVEVIGVAGVRRYLEGASLEEQSGRSLAALEASWLRRVGLL